MDRFPELPGLRETLGRSIYVCPDCDGYEIQDRSTVLIGSGISGLNMAFILRQRTPHLIYINHEKSVVPKQRDHLEVQGIIYIEEAIARLESGEDGMIRGVTLEDGGTVPAERGFIAMGGNSVHSELAEQLGVELHKNRHIEANRRSLMTNVEGVWAAGMWLFMRNRLR